MTGPRVLKLLLIALVSLLIVIFISSCDNTFFEIYTNINTDYSGTRTVELAVKTEYLKKGEIILEKDESIYDKILTSLPEGKIETYEEDFYTHFKSTIEFDDINFLQHVSIDNYSEVPPERFYAKMEKNDYFFYSEYFFYDYVDVKIEDAIIEASGESGDMARLAGLFSADEDLLKITYQVKFPVNIINTNADRLGEDNIAIWEPEFGEQVNIQIEGKRTKWWAYVLLAVLGLIVLFILFLVFILAYSRKRRRIKTKQKKPYYEYDNYFKYGNNYNGIDDTEDY
jgi:hypothetical protein